MQHRVHHRISHPVGTVWRGKERKGKDRKCYLSHPLNFLATSQVHNINISAKCTSQQADLFFWSAKETQPLVVYSVILFSLLCNIYTSVHVFILTCLDRPRHHDFFCGDTYDIYCNMSLSSPLRHDIICDPNECINQSIDQSTSQSINQIDGRVMMMMMVVLVVQGTVYQDEWVLIGEGGLDFPDQPKSTSPLIFVGPRGEGSRGKDGFNGPTLEAVFVAAEHFRRRSSFPTFSSSSGGGRYFRMPPPAGRSSSYSLYATE